MESIIESLEKFGLTRYEAKAYIGMTNLISGKAEEIAKVSEIPRSKIYNTLKELDKKGFKTQWAVMMLSLVVLLVFGICRGDYIASEFIYKQF